MPPSTWAAAPPPRGSAAITSLRNLIPTADIRLLIMDHMDLSSVVSAAKDFAETQPKLHGLIANAGIVAEKGSGGVWSQYGMSKLANILHAKELDRLYGPGGVKKGESGGEIWTAAVHPGDVYTDLSRNAMFFGISGLVAARVLNAFGAFTPAEKGAYTSVFCAASAEMEGHMSVGYFVPLGKVAKPSRHARDGELGMKLWAWSVDESGGKGKNLL
ncbi:hypothetical protein LSUE1_G004572 [Lachnellula suecica]|uniref:Oxidoreductase n=1 Tax=Lachnellula suecica TaxID=602035 RepID=A0A8T9CBW4_9HELO|nr:hypothetical protein LSUE1_G004572 [Lachnellula suecica]